MLRFILGVVIGYGLAQCSTPPVTPAHAAGKPNFEVVVKQPHETWRLMPRCPDRNG